MDQFFNNLSKAGSAIGKGLIAGAAGTIAMTISQMIEMKLTNRGGSSTPVIVAGKALGVEPKGQGKLEAKKENSQDDKSQYLSLENKVKEHTSQFSQLIHYAYGTSQGIPRGILDLTGLKGWQAAVAHFAVVWGTEQIMLPATGASKPISKWPTEMIISDLIHHAVYVSVTGLVYDQMQKTK